MKKKIFVVAAILISSRSFSQLPDSVVVNLDEFPWSHVELSRVVVTASKYPRKQAATGKVMTVIPRHILERNTGKTLSEVLNGTAGTNILGSSAALGTNQTISIRGASAGNVLLLIDGIPVNDPSLITNYFDLNLIPIDQVERIEILKGGQSTLYGSDAVAGVINIIMRKNSSRRLSVTGNLAGGSYGTFKQNIGLAANTKKAGYSLNYTYIGSKGFSAAHDDAGDSNFDKDGYDQHAVGGRVNIVTGKRTQAYISGSGSFYKADLDATAFTDEKDYTVTNKNAQAGAGFSWKHQWGALHFNYNFNYVSRRYVDDSVFKGSPYVDYSDNRFIGRTHFAELYNNWNWEYMELLTGVDYRFNNTDQYSLYIFPGFPTPPSTLKGKMSQVSPYASFILKNAEGFTAELGARFNHHSEYGQNLSFTFNPAYRLTSVAKLFFNLYSAYKTPTLYQLFDPSAGNINLEPEKGTIAEAGAELYKNTNGWLRVTGFYRNTKNAIQYILVNPSTFESQYRNQSRQENYGAEVEATYKISKCDFAFNYTYTDGKTRSSYDGTGAPLGKDTTYYNLYRIPKHAFNVTINWFTTKQLLLSLQFRAVSKREEFIYGATPETYKGYATLGLYSEYTFTNKVKAFLDLKNITNRQYFELPGYNSRRFNFMTGVNFNL